MRMLRKALLNAAAVLLVPAAGARAHHTMEMFPWLILKREGRAGNWELRMTGYPKRPEPGDLTELHVRVSDRETGAPYEGAVRLETARLLPDGGRERIFGPDEGNFMEDAHNYSPVYPDEGRYELKFAWDGASGPLLLYFTIEVRKSSLPWETAAVFTGSVAALLLGVRLLRARRRRPAGRT